jgi:hypothetical protein
MGSFMLQRKRVQNQTHIACGQPTTATTLHVRIEATQRTAVMPLQFGRSEGGKLSRLGTSEDRFEFNFQRRIVAAAVPFTAESPAP